MLSEWRYDPLYSAGWSVERMFDETDVVDTAGEEIGDVENIIFSDDGRVLSVIAEVGGVWDIGDTHVSIPWEEARLSEDGTRLTVPVTEDNVDDYSVFEKKSSFFQTDTEDIAKVEDDLATGTTVFKATDLMGDYAYLSENTRYGYVTDMIVNNGTISAVIVDAAAYGRPGFYAYPYYGYNAAPSYYPRYNLPYAADEIDVLENFDYDQLRSQS
ncbi:PRC-barrel domain-containing protein [Roseibium salinum]|nr:PRC-barrel domain-containing protein [Roseibium salinum]